MCRNICKSKTMKMLPFY